MPADRPLGKPLNPRDRTLDRIAARRVRSDHLLPEGSGVLAAVSGGADSVALLHFLATESAPPETAASTPLPSGSR